MVAFFSQISIGIPVLNHPIHASTSIGLKHFAFSGKIAQKDFAFSGNINPKHFAFSGNFGIFRGKEPLPVHQEKAQEGENGHHL